MIRILILLCLVSSAFGQNVINAGTFEVGQVDFIDQDEAFKNGVYLCDNEEPTKSWEKPLKVEPICVKAVMHGPYGCPDVIEWRKSNEGSPKSNWNYGSLDFRGATIEPLPKPAHISVDLDYLNDKLIELNDRVLRLELSLERLRKALE